MGLVTTIDVMSTHCRRLAAVFVASLMVALPSGADVDAWGEVDMTKHEALNQVAFPDADHIQRRTLFLEPEQQQRLSDTAHSRFESRLLTVYTGYRGNQVIGYAFIDSAIVRSKPAATLTVLARDGTLRELRILAWQEPPDYRPPQRWLQRLAGRRLDGPGSLRVGHDVDGISGATLSVRMLTAHVRRALAIHDVLLDELSLAEH
ncbi:MAG: FMN-binding protein [Pseudomonadales bacterium]|nr:FMN-binding protein [Pseudomonadales bacterium]